MKSTTAKQLATMTRFALKPHALTTREFLDMLRLKYKRTSDYQLAKMLEVGHTRISNWRVGRNTFDDEMALQVAHLLDLPPAFVLTCMAAERTKNETLKREWGQLAAKLAFAVSVLLAVVHLALTGETGNALEFFALMPLAWPTSYTLYALAAIALVLAWSLLRVPHGPEPR